MPARHSIDGRIASRSSPAPNATHVEFIVSPSGTSCGTPQQRSEWAWKAQTAYAPPFLPSGCATRPQSHPVQGSKLPDTLRCDSMTRCGVPRKLLARDWIAPAKHASLLRMAMATAVKDVRCRSWIQTSACEIVTSSCQLVNSVVCLRFPIPVSIARLQSVSGYAKGHSNTARRIGVECSPAAGKSVLRTTRNSVDRIWSPSGPGNRRSTGLGNSVHR